MTDGALFDDRAELRCRLVAMRAELIASLMCDRGSKGGTLALLAGMAPRSRRAMTLSLEMENRPRPMRWNTGA